MAIPSTPTTFLVQAGNGNAYLSWDQMSGATTYFVQRSQDNITFSSLATVTGSPLNNYFLDTTGVSGTQYWYQVAANNISGTSAYTTPYNVIVVGDGLFSLGALRLYAQQRCDRVNSTFVSTEEWNQYISESYKELYDLIVQKFGDDYYGPVTYTWTTDGSSVLYPLPKDFYKNLLVEVALNPSDPNSYITLKKFMRIQQNLWNYPNVYTFYGITNIRYRVDGSFIHLVPIAQAGYTLRMWYVPRPNVLMADNDIIDGVSGWEEYIVVDAAIKALVKEESDVSAFMAQKAALKMRIEEAAEHRDVQEPDTVSDSKLRNFAWSESDGMGSSGMGW